MFPGFISTRSIQPRGRFDLAADHCRSVSTSDVGHSRPVPPDRLRLDWEMFAVSLAEARVAGEEEYSPEAYTDYVGEDIEGKLALPSSQDRFADSEAATLAFDMGRPWDYKDRSGQPPRQTDITHDLAVTHSVRWIAPSIEDKRCYILTRC